MLSATTVKPIAQAGFAAKGIVYCLLGILSIMAALNIGGDEKNKTDMTGVFDFIGEQTGGKIMLAVLALGLASYCIWRLIQTFTDTEDKGSDAKGLAARARYLFSGLVYGYLAVNVVKMLLWKSSGSGDKKQDMAGELLTKPFGQWLVGITAVILLAVGIYQIYYGLSEKHRKHVDKAGHESGRKLLLLAGKIGYVARGVVWMLLAWLFFKAAISANSSEAGDTSKAFNLLQDSSYGTYLLAFIAGGLICYGVFNLIRAKYENFGNGNL